MATAQRARHVHGDPDCLVSVRFGDGIGDSVSHTVPFYRGYAPPHAVLRLDLVGCDLTEYLMKLVTERENSFTAAAERKFVRDAKKKLCYVAFVYDSEVKSTAESSDKKQTYMLSDGNVVTVGAERLRCPSVLPASIIGIQASGILDTSSSSNMKIYVYILVNLCANVVLSGGTTHCYIALDSDTVLTSTGEKFRQ